MDSSLSQAAIVSAIVLLLLVAAIHYFGARMAGERKQAYYFTLLGLLIATPFIPVIDGGDKMGPIPLWAAYRIITIPAFFSAGSRQGSMDLIVCGTLLLHHFGSVTTSVFCVKTLFKKRKQ